MVQVKDRNQYAHRVIWTMVNGEIPPGIVIDHLNGIPSDNRVENLSLKTGPQNSRAKNKKVAHNTSGFEGVSWRKDMKKWVVQLVRNKKYYRLGFFSDIMEAAKVADEAKKKWAEENNEEVRFLNLSN